MGTCYEEPLNAKIIVSWYQLFSSGHITFLILSVPATQGPISPGRKSWWSRNEIFLGSGSLT